MAKKVKLGSVFLHDGTVMLRRGQEQPAPLSPPEALASEVRAALERAGAGEEIDVRYTPRGDSEVENVRLRAPVESAVKPQAPPKPPRPVIAPASVAAAPQHDAAPLPGGEFENPYNFVPPNPSLRAHPDLGERQATGLERLHADRISGRISVRFTVRTPVLIADVDFTDNNGHKTYSSRTGTDPDSTVIPPTTIKGPLRSAFESITASRFGVMSRAYEDPVGLRLPAAASSASLVPVRIVKRADGSFEAELLTGSHPGPVQHGKNPLLYPASLPTYNTAKPHCRPEVPPGEGLAHGDRVAVTLSMERRPHYREWVVITASKLAADAPSSPGDASEGMQTADGWVCRTNANIGKKRSERVFFCVGTPAVLTVSTTVQREWSALIRDYQRVHSLEIAKRLGGLADTQANRRAVAARFDGDKIGKTSFSRHVYEPDAVTLRTGTLCYARLKVVQSGHRIEALYPVMLSRVLARKSPLELAGDLAPATVDDQLTSADRTFGWVSASGAIRGRVRIGPVRCEQGPDRFNGAKMLANLSSPKPAQGRFYEARDRFGTPLGNVAKEGFYGKDSRGLRGWKVYPHQRGFDLGTGEWQGRTATEQNCSIDSWLAPDTTFDVDIHLDDVSRVEAGALLWLLDLGRRNAVLKIGRGKPLGFGSVAPEVTERTRLHSGASLRQALRDLSEPDAAEDIDDLERAFLDAVGGEETTHVRAFLNAALGTNNAVRYPRRGNDAEKQYEWFVSNEKGPKHSLPPLASDDRRLPRL